jgi:GH15 family glucan-1,4-alpha-glucosidase
MPLTGGGAFVVQPIDEFDAAAHYVPHTNILISRFRTRKGIMKLTDFMPIPFGGPEENETARHTLIRLIEIEKGEMEVRMRFEPRFDYARAETSLEGIECGVLAQGGDQSLALTATRPMDISNGKAFATWRLQAGEKICLRAGSSGVLGRCADLDMVPIDQTAAEEALEETADYWRTWLKQSETGCRWSFGHYQPMIERSALVLKLRSFHSTGAEKMQIMYGLRGERDLAGGGTASFVKATMREH